MGAGKWEGCETNLGKLARLPPRRAPYWSPLNPIRPEL